MTPLLDAALDCARNGWPVFPCVPRGKAPLTIHGFHDATMDAAIIRAWWLRWPEANIASPTGASTFDVLDIDVRDERHGWAAFEKLRLGGLLVGAVRVVRTPSTGLHLYFPGSCQPSASIRASYIDLKAMGGYVLVPPSFVATDTYEGAYVEEDSTELAGRPLDWQAVLRLLAPPPAAHLLRDHRRDQPGVRLAGLRALVERAPVGNRNRALFWAACRLGEAGGGADIDDLVDAAIRAGLSEVEARRTASSAVRTIGGSA